MKLSIVLGRHGQVQDLRAGEVTVPGVDLEFTEIKRMPDAYREMARTQPYDICEMAPTSYLMARAAGAPITALPIPMTRRFRHAGLLRLKSSDIRGPKDLEGRRVGVRAYAVTAAVWTRGIYADEFGVDASKITWLTQEDENVKAFGVPSNVHRTDRKLADLLAAGELQAAFAGLAGAGSELDGQLVDVVGDAAEREADWFKRTGIYPLHGVIVVRDDVLAANPGLAAALFDAFGQAKRNYLARIESGQASGAEDLRYRRLGELVGDPLPYGLAENEASLTALVRYAHEQGLIPERPPVERVFHEPREAQA